MVVLSHSPMRCLAEEYSGKRVMVLGSSAKQIAEEDLGLRDTVRSCCVSCLLFFLVVCLFSQFRFGNNWIRVLVLPVYGWSSTAWVLAATGSNGRAPFRCFVVLGSRERVRFGSKSRYAAPVAWFLCSCVPVAGKMLLLSHLAPCRRSKLFRGSRLSQRSVDEMSAVSETPPPCLIKMKPFAAGYASRVCMRVARYVPLHGGPVLHQQRLSKQVCLKKLTCTLGCDVVLTFLHHK